MKYHSHMQIMEKEWATINCPRQVHWCYLTRSVKGSKMCQPELCQLGMQRWRQSRPVESRKAFHLPFNSVKEFIKEAYTSKRVITRDKVFIGETCLHVKANIYLPNISSSHYPVNCLPPLWSPRSLSLSLVQDGMYLSLNCLDDFESHIFVINFVFLLLICYFITGGLSHEPREVRENGFSPCMWKSPTEVKKVIGQFYRTLRCCGISNGRPWKGKNNKEE